MAHFPPFLSGESVIVGVCLPLGASKHIDDVTEIASLNQEATMEASSLKELEAAGAGPNVFFDRTTGVLYAKFREERFVFSFVLFLVAKEELIGRKNFKILTKPLFFLRLRKLYN